MVSLNRLHKCMGALPPTIKYITQRPRVSTLEQRPGVSIQKGPSRSRLHVVLTRQGGRQGAATVASLFALSASMRTLCPRTLLPTHDAWPARLYVVKEVLQRLIEFAVATSTEEGNP